MKLFRWKAVVPLVIVLVILVVGWVLFADRIVRKTVEFVGTELVGARVDLASADIRLLKGNVTLKGLQVTNPDKPMTNLVQMDEIVAQVSLRPLLEKKTVLDTVAVRGVRFGTPRKTSGALAHPSPTTGLVTRRLLDWAHSIPIPKLDLSGLSHVTQVAGLSADSLQSLREARALAARADSLRNAVESELRASDPAPILDSARVLTERLRGATPRSLGVQGTADAVASLRRVRDQLRSSRDRVTSLKARVDSGVAGLQQGAVALDRARQADYAYAQRLVKIPSLAAPDVSMALFGEMAMARLKPVLYWLNLADQYIPPGLRPQLNPAAPRVRMAGVDVSFPREHTWPTFLLRHADASLLLGGRNAVAGAYRGWAEGVTSEPRVYGGPLRFGAQRTASAEGPRDVRVAGLLDRSKSEVHDSVDALVSGVAFPSADIAAAGARIEFPDGTVRLALDRRGDGVAGLLRLSAAGVRWTRTATDTGAGAGSPLGSKPWVEALVWRAVSAVRDVDVEVRFSGRPDAPRMDVSSNVGAAVSAALTREVGAEVARVQAKARAKVDSMVTQQVAAARAKITSIQTEVQGRLGTAQQQLQDVETQIENRIGELGQVVPGVRLPGVPRIRP